MNSPISLFGQYSNMMAVNFLVYLIKVSGFFWRTSRPSFRSLFYDSTSKQHWGSWPLLSKVLYNIPSGFFHVKTIQESIVSNKKNTSSWFWNLCFSRISPEPLELQQNYLNLFASLSKELSDEATIFQFGYKISWYLQKRCFARKNMLLEKIGHFKKFKSFFS